MDLCGDAFPDKVLEDPTPISTTGANDCRSTDCLWRSTRNKQQVCYNENLSDDDSANKESASDDDDGDDEVEDGSTIGNQLEERLSYPSPEFHNFDEKRNKGCFFEGQIWALYDDLDAMPRFCARIMKVYSPGFKLEITWLEPSPDYEEERLWICDGLSPACGKFIYGEKADVETPDKFSHLVIPNGGRMTTYTILPKKGEIWALFRSYDAIGKHADVANRNDYEFAEILSDFGEDEGTYVAYLDKLTGFVSLFCRSDADKVQIPPMELFLFSHMVPFFRITGKERNGVPRGTSSLMQLPYLSFIYL